MKIKKTNMLIIFLFLVAIISLGSVAATDDVVTTADNSNIIDTNETTEFQEVISNDTINQENSVMLDDEMSLMMEDDSLNDNGQVNYENDSFTALDKLITDNRNGTIILGHDYIMYSDEVSTYANGITINKNITINVNGYTINANKTGRIFNVTNTGNLTLINGKFTNGNITGDGGVIYLEGTVTVVNSTFTNNHASFGGVIYNDYNGKVTLTNSTFTNNTASSGGVINNRGVKCSAVNSTFTNNTAFSGGVINNFASAGFSVVNSTFIGNNAGAYGGVVYNVGDDFSVVNSIFTNNTALAGGVIFDNNDVGNFTVINSIFTGNTATDSKFGGGVIYNNYGTSFSVLNSTFIDNTANTYGSAIDNVRNASFTIVNSTFITNIVNSDVIIYNEEDANFTVVNSTFIGNHDMIGVSTVYQDCVLTILTNNQPITSVNPNENFNLTAKLVDNQGNTYYSTGLTYQIYNETGLVKEITADNLFNAITNLTNSGFYNISANYTDPGHTITTYNVINASVYVNTVVLIGEDLTKYYKGNEKYNIYLKLNDNPLAGETVALTINGVTYDFVTDNNGLISLPIGLSAGNYTIFSVYNGYYGVATLKNNITVNPTIKGEDTTVYYRNGSSYIVHVMDSQGRTVVGQNVRMNINGVFYDRVTDSKGNAYLPIGLNAGKYVITAENPTNGEKTSNIVTVLATLVDGQDVSVYHRNGSGYSIKALDGQGNPVKGVTVRMNINGVFYDRVTDSNGYAFLPIGLNPGEYIITTEYNGFMTSNKITVLPVLIGNDISLYYRDGTSYNVKLLDGQGKPLTYTNVTMNINGVFYYRTTNTDGVADLPIGLLPGKYIITTTYQDHATSNTVTVLARD